MAQWAIRMGPGATCKRSWAGGGPTAAVRGGAKRLGIPTSRVEEMSGWTGMIADARRQLVTRRCRVCEWQGERVETTDADVDCPWCQAPTRRVRAIALLERRRPLGVRGHAA